MPTFQVTCSDCDKEKWPTLPERPDTYRCVLCSMLPAGVKSGRSQAGAKGAAKRRAKATA